MLGESLRQHFLRSGVQDTVSALQTTSAVMTSAQKELSAALRTLSDSQGGVVAQVERANNRIEYSLENRAKIMDTLLHEWKSDLLRIWVPMVAAASMLIGLFGGVEIQGCRDSACQGYQLNQQHQPLRLPRQRQTTERQKIQTSRLVATTRRQMRALTADDRSPLSSIGIPKIY